MKKILLLILATMPLFCFAQKVDTKIDDFTGEKVVTTSWEKIYSGGATGKNQTRIRFRHEGGVDLIEFRVFTDCATSCNKGQEMLLKNERRNYQSKKCRIYASKTRGLDPKWH